MSEFNIEDLECMLSEFDYVFEDDKDLLELLKTGAFTYYDVVTAQLCINKYNEFYALDEGEMLSEKEINRIISLLEDTLENNEGDFSMDISDSEDSSSEDDMMTREDHDRLLMQSLQAESSCNDSESDSDLESEEDLYGLAHDTKLVDETKDYVVFMVLKNRSTAFKYINGRVYNGDMVIVPLKKENYHSFTRHRVQYKTLNKPRYVAMPVNDFDDISLSKDIIKMNCGCFTILGQDHDGVVKVVQNNKFLSFINK